MIRIFHIGLVLVSAFLLHGCGGNSDDAGNWFTIDNDAGMDILNQRLVIDSDNIRISSTDAFITDGDYKAYVVTFQLPNELSPADWLELIRNQTFLYKGIFMYADDLLAYELSSLVFGDYRRIEYDESAKVYRLLYAKSSNFKPYF